MDQNGSTSVGKKRAVLDLFLGEGLLVGLPAGTPSGVPLPDFGDQGVWLLLGAPPDGAVLTGWWHDIEMARII
jgi:hypothetical protein